MGKRAGAQPAQNVNARQRSVSAGRSRPTVSDLLKDGGAAQSRRAPEPSENLSRPRSSEGRKNVGEKQARKEEAQPKQLPKEQSRGRRRFNTGDAWNERRRSVAEDFENQKVSILKQRFRTMDSDGDGMLSFEEFSSMLKRGNPTFADRELHMLFSGVDVDANGYISFEEFVDYIFIKERLSLDDCISEARKSGREWTEVDDIRFKRLVGKDQKVSKEDQEFISKSPRTWGEVSVRRPKAKRNRHSLTIAEGEQISGQLRERGVFDARLPEDPTESFNVEELSPESDAAALAMQKSFRGVMARNEVQRKRCWQIYQAVEYQIEFNQTSMQEFLGRLVQVLPEEHHTSTRAVQTSFDDRARGGWPRNIAVPSSYDGPVIPDEFTLESILELLTHFAVQAHDRSLPQLHVRYVYLILVAFRRVLQSSNTIQRISTNEARVITIVGDLHGQLRDLAEIFRRNGAPSIDNPYLFNGDLVDRGEQSLEVVLVLFGLAAASPGAVHINRGNHEDMGICRSYGFADELVSKYADAGDGNTLTALFTEIFAMLPLATIIDEDILVVHGGISQELKLEDVNQLKRHKYRELSEGVPVGEDESGYSAVASMLWSDPLDRSDTGYPFWGCTPNETRGIGSFWGSDVTEEWLHKYHLALMIRSHECVQHGFDIKHNGRVITLFSASNYYEEGSNLAAYCVLHRDRGVNLQQFQTSVATGNALSNTKFSKSVKKMEDGAVEQLRHLLLSRKTELMKEFTIVDRLGTGKVPLRTWVDVVQRVTDVHVPWITVHSKLVDSAEEDGALVLWRSCLAPRALPTTKNRAIASGLYTNLRQMEAVFKLLDADGSGSISVGELGRAAEILNQAKCGKGKQITDDFVKDIIISMDMDGDGVVNYNEFLEAMRNAELA